MNRNTRCVWNLKNWIVVVDLTRSVEAVGVRIDVDTSHSQHAHDRDDAQLEEMNYA